MLLTSVFSHLCEPVAYCDACDVAAGIVRARQRDGSLHHGAIHKDIRSLSGGKVDGILAGFPCQDISLAGQQAGVHGQRSNLVFEALRLTDEAGCSFIFTENVANLCKLLGVWQQRGAGTLQRHHRAARNGSRCWMRWAAAASRSNGASWKPLTLARRSEGPVGSRWRAEGLRVRLSACPLPDGRIPDFALRNGLRFRAAPPSSWLLPREELPRVAARLNMLGMRSCRCKRRWPRSC